MGTHGSRHTLLVFRGDWICAQKRGLGAISSMSWLLAPQGPQIGRFTCYNALKYGNIPRWTGYFVSIGLSGSGFGNLRTGSGGSAVDF